MKSEVDDWLSELPPLDGADDDPAAEEGSHDDLLPDRDDDASLDDSAADDLDVDDGVDIDDDEPSAPAEDERWEADVGEPELDLLDDAMDGSAEGDAPGIGDTDLDLDDDLPPSADDAGEEGTSDAIEHSIDEQLPALDADDEGDFEDALLLEAGLMVAVPEGPRWAAEPWERHPSADRALVITVPDDDAVAAMAMCLEPELLVSVTAAGRLLVDADGADSGGGRLLPPALLAAKAGPSLVALTRNGAQHIWIASRTGQLAHSVDLGRSWSVPRDLGKAPLALAAGAGGSIAVLATRGGYWELLTPTGATTWETRPVVGDVGPLPAIVSTPPWLALGTSCLAIGDASGVWVSRNGSEFLRVASSPTTTAGVFAGREPDAPMLFAEAPADADENARLFLASAVGRVEIIAEIGPRDLDDARDVSTVLALGWNETEHALRVAFATVVCTVAAPRPKA
jgi:hypothetical protein